MMSKQHYGNFPGWQFSEVAVILAAIVLSGCPKSYRLESVFWHGTFQTRNMWDTNVLIKPHICRTIFRWFSFTLYLLSVFGRITSGLRRPSPLAYAVDRSTLFAFIIKVASYLKTVLFQFDSSSSVLSHFRVITKFLTNETNKPECDTFNCTTLPAHPLPICTKK